MKTLIGALQYKRVAIALLLFALVLSAIGIELVAVQVHAQPTKPVQPHLGSCFGDGLMGFPGCDGYLPPGKSSCPGNLYDNTYPMQDRDGTTIAWLHLWQSNTTNGCGSEWAAVQAISYCFTVKNVTFNETTGDKSFEGANLSVPRTLCGGGPVWLSTYMAGTPDSGHCGYAYANFVDKYGISFEKTSSTLCGRS